MYIAPQKTNHRSISRCKETSRTWCAANPAIRPSTPSRTVTHSQRNVDNLEFDMETLKNKYANINENALVFLIKWQRTASNKQKSSKGNQSASIRSDGEQGIFEEIRSASSTCASSLLPPQKRFIRASKRAILTTTT